MRAFDEDRNGQVNYEEFLRGVRGRLNSTRKKMVRQIAGKYAHHTMGSLKIGGPGGRNAKKNDLVDGATVHCTYTYTAGNPGFGGFRGRGRGSNHLLFAMMFGGGGGGGMSDY